MSCSSFNNVFLVLVEFFKRFQMFMIYLKMRVRFVMIILREKDCALNGDYLAIQITLHDDSERK